MGGASTGGGGGGVGPAGVRVSKKGVKTYGTAKDAKKTSRRNETRKAVTDFVKSGGIVGSVVKSVTKKAKQSLEKSKAKRQANVELGLGTDRMSNYSIDEGGTRERGGEADRVQGIEAPPTIIKKTAGGQTVQVTAPTEAELSQSAAADADDIYIRRKKSKARGRSMMTLTSAQGVKDNKLTLGKPSLLGS